MLDIGCGDGDAAALSLAEDHGVDARGIELSQKGVNQCVASGLSVIQGDADTDLADYPDDAFDFVILSQTLQATRRPRQVLEHMLRIGRHAVVSFPNFGHWKVRGQLLLSAGRMPITDALAYQWYDTPNIHAFTIRDFVTLVEMCEGRIERSVALDQNGHLDPGQGAVVVLESLRRAGGVSADASLAASQIGGAAGRDKRWRSCMDVPKMTYVHLIYQP